MKRVFLIVLDSFGIGEMEDAARIARMKGASKGKATTIGQWEIAGILSEQSLPTYPGGFPKEALDAFSAAVGRGALCNKPYSGTEVIKVYGDEHVGKNVISAGKIKDIFADIGAAVFHYFGIKPEFAGTSML